MQDSLIDKMIEKGVNINNFQEVFNFFHSITAIEDDLLNLLSPYFSNLAESIVNEAVKDKANQAEIELALSQKLDRNEYNNHFKGVFKSYISLIEANIVAIDGDYAHIDGGQNFGRMAAIWDSDDEKWTINTVNVALNTDEMPEGESNLYFTAGRVQNTVKQMSTTDLKEGSNLYFKAERVKNTQLLDLVEQNPTTILTDDTLIVAIPKIQAQLNTPKTNTVKWYKASEIGTLSNISDSVIVNGETVYLEFSKINGMLWMKGGFTCTKANSADIPFLTLNSEWKLRALKSGNLSNNTAAFNISNIDSPNSENFIYVYSNTQTIKDTTTPQTLRVKYFMAIGNWSIAASGAMQGAICLGPLITP